MALKITLIATLIPFFATHALADDIVNIRTNPLMVFGSFVHLEVDVRLGQHHALGPALTVSGVEPAFEAGLNYTYFEQGAFQTGWQWTLSALAGQEVTGYDDDWATGDDKYTTDWIYRAGVTPGYLWRWDTFNASAGLGVNALYQAEVDDVTVHTTLLFSIGWAR